MPAQARILRERQAGVREGELGPEALVVGIADGCEQRERVGAAVEEERDEHRLGRRGLGRLEDAVLEERQPERAGAVDRERQAGRPEHERAPVEPGSRRNRHPGLDSRKTRTGLGDRAAKERGTGELVAAIGHDVSSFGDQGDGDEVAERGAKSQEGLTKRSLCRRAALLAPRTASSVAPVSTDTGTPCVLASERPSHPCDERHSAKPS
jgi:hypothetical protein